MNIDRKRSSNTTFDFTSATPIMTFEEASAKVRGAFDRWKPVDAVKAEEIHTALNTEFPDEEPPAAFWHSASSKAFRDFFVWGHDHDFGHGFTRSGAMGSRHIEIMTEGMQHGMLPTSYTGKDVLDIGCWSGGDLMVLAGLGGRVEALEEHPIAASAARRMCGLLGIETSINDRSLYADRQDWAGRFDHIYCSGVVYHVTDPLLFLRICFAYLRPGGSIFLETKAVAPGEGSFCGYSGILEKGWNWYAPNEDALGRWLVDAGFAQSSVRLYRRQNGRLLAAAVKEKQAAMVETAGFSRPQSWLEGIV